MSKTHRNNVQCFNLHLPTSVDLYLIFLIVPSESNFRGKIRYVEFLRNSLKIKHNRVVKVIMLLIWGSGSTKTGNWQLIINLSDSFFTDSWYHEISGNI